MTKNLENLAKPLVIGLPGLLDKNDKGGRITQILSAVAQQGFNTLEIFYPNITLSQDGKFLKCEFDVEETTRAVREQLGNYKAENHAIDEDNISFVTSSMGAAYFTRFLAADETGLKPKTLVQISPFIKLHPETEKIVRMIYGKKGDLPFTSEQDGEKGFSRIIPNAFIPAVLELNALDDLLKIKRESYPINCLTLYGKKDNRADPAMTIAYHQQIGGKEEDLMAFETYHSVPEYTNELAINFLQTTLKSN